MSILVHYLFMINTVQQLNDWAAKEGVKAHCDLLPKLIEHKEIVSSEMAKLLQQSKQSDWMLRE